MLCKWLCKCCPIIFYLGFVSSVYSDILLELVIYRFNIKRGNFLVCGLLFQFCWPVSLKSTKLTSSIQCIWLVFFLRGATRRGFSTPILTLKPRHLVLLWYLGNLRCIGLNRRNRKFAKFRLGPFFHKKIEFFYRSTDYTDSAKWARSRGFRDKIPLIVAVGQQKSK